MTGPVLSVRGGIAWMIAATLLWSMMDTLNKYLSHQLPPAQVALMRFVMHTALIFIFCAPILPRLLKTSSLRAQLIRGGFLAVGTYLIVVSFQRMPMLFVTSVSMLTPVLVTAISVPLLRERVGWRRWAGVLAGFVGALIVVGPASVEVSLLVLFPLGQALVNALYQISTRGLGSRDSPYTTITYTGITGTVIALALIPLVLAGVVPKEEVWVDPDLIQWGLLTLVGLLGVVSHFCMILAFTAAPASVAAPFAYAGLIWSALVGLFVFDEIPTHATIVGAIVIACSGLHILRRERKRGVEATPPRDSP